MRLLDAVALFLIAAPAFGQEKITLDEAVRRATARNPTALIGEQEIRRAEAILKEVRAPSLPFLTANGIGTRIDSARTTYNASDPTHPNLLAPRDQLSGNVQLSVPLFAPQRWRAHLLEDSLGAADLLLGNERGGIARRGAPDGLVQGNPLLRERRRGDHEERDGLKQAHAQPRAGHLPSAAAAASGRRSNTAPAPGTA